MPWSRVLGFTDPFAYQSAFRSVDEELFLTAKGKFRGELTQIDKSWRSSAKRIPLITPHQ